ncbi:MAG TPA: 50S ribosomal protein L10 [Candidatus Saccharimonadia bacterium]|nr:50S ribosomal protein L10 [Candidatus Saccharimonadia bacterium]
MPNKKNVASLADLKEKVAKAKSIVLMNYQGLTVAQQTKLRSEVKSAGGEFVVAKNTLVNIALNKPELKDALGGQTGVLFSYTDEVGALKKLVEFVKANEKPELKMGVMSDKALSKAEVMELSKLPGKEQLIGMLMARLQGPATGMVNVLNAGVRNLVYALNAIKSKKEASN